MCIETKFRLRKNRESVHALNADSLCSGLSLAIIDLSRCYTRCDLRSEMPTDFAMFKRKKQARELRKWLR